MARQTPLLHFTMPLTPPRSGLGNRIAQAVLKAVLVVESWQETARTRRALGELNPRQLADIGLTQTQAENEATKPFWQK